MRIYTCAPTPPVPRPAWASAAGSRATTPPGPIRHSAIGRPMRSTNHRRSRGLLRHRSVWQHDRHYSPQGDRPELRSLSRLSKLGGPAQFQKARTIDHAGGEIALLAPGCDLSQRRGIGLDGQHLDQCPPDLDDRQPSMEGFATAALRVDRLHPHVDHALTPFQGGKHGLNRPAKRNDHVFGWMTRISGQQKPFRCPFAIDEHRYPNHSDQTPAEEAGPADGGAIANGAVAAIDRQFRL